VFFTTALYQQDTDRLSILDFRTASHVQVKVPFPRKLPIHFLIFFGLLL
jgi:hypothetical protein